KNRSLEYVLKDGSVFKAQTVPIGYSDKEILGDPKVPNSSIQPTRWKARDFSIDIPRDLYWKDWTESGRALPPDADTISIPRMKFRVEPTIQGQGIRVQDMMVLDILFANKFRRPMYYAITVSDDNKVGLGRYLRMDGLAYKLVTVPDTDMSIDHMYENTFKKYKYRNMNRSDVSYDDNIKRLTQNYRTMFLRLVEFYRQQKGTPNPRQTALDKDFPESLTVDQKIVAILDSMSATISEEAIPMRDWRLKLAIGQFYAEAGRPDVLQNSVDEVLANERKYRLDQQGKIRVAALELYVLKNAQQAAELLKPMYESNPSNVEALSYYLQALEDTKQFDEAVRLLDEWLVRNPNDNAAKSKLAEIRAKAGTPQKE
ncbi:MAG: tetratricopeptide repeat protein, partial [Bacteroidetes bacterium]|nr:tetratricopeptide repeat protein [Bacteroidota bacterium]